MLTLLVHAYCVGEPRSRQIEHRCREDVAFRVICANQVPDHTTISRFRQRHGQALSDIFGQVLALCAEAGLVRTGVVAVDGSKFAAEPPNVHRVKAARASQSANVHRVDAGWTSQRSAAAHSENGSAS
jgi:transposase-like protein DUF772